MFIREGAARGMDVCLEHGFAQREGGGWTARGILAPML